MPLFLLLYFWSLKLLDFFILTQYVRHPSHYKGHTLDLVLSRGFRVDDVNLVDFAISDHKAAVVLLISPDPIHPPPPHTHIHLFHTHTHTYSLLSPKFPLFLMSVKFLMPQILFSIYECQGLTVEQLVSVFSSSYTKLFDSIGPVRH